MTIYQILFVILASIVLTFSLTLVMYDSVEGLGWEQTDVGMRGGIRG